MILGGVLVCPGAFRPVMSERHWPEICMARAVACIAANPQVNHPPVQAFYVLVRVIYQQDSFDFWQLVCGQARLPPCKPPRLASHRGLCSLANRCPHIRRCCWGCR